MAQKILYLECNSGISGDMTVGALLDLGADEDKLRKELLKLPVSGYQIRTKRVEKCGISCLAFRVPLEGENHDHGEHHHRTYKDIREMIYRSRLEEAVKEKAVKIFHVLAKAEAAVHDRSVDEVHFHEVGAVDSIVDIVGTAICLVDLGIEEVAISSLAEGYGTVMCQHGEIPVPVPAVLELAKNHGLPIRQIDIKGEMITPTGAAIAAAMRTREVPETFMVSKVGMGAGTKEFPHANVLRGMLIEEQNAKNSIWILETNVDDYSGEQLGYLQDELLQAGAKDVSLMPVYMKKNRPAYQLTVLCDEDKINTMEDLIFRESSSIGIRRFQAERSVLERRVETIETPYGDAEVKICTYGGQAYYYPEYESVRLLGIIHHQSYRRMYDDIKKEVKVKYEG